MKMIRITTLFLLCVISSPAFAQEKDSVKLGETRVFAVSTTEDQYRKYLPDYSPQSPNTAGITGFQDYQVNLATGVPDISIPIYTIKAGNLTLPITLKYHASGHRLQDEASWVGWGWNLDHGSVVTRSVQGLPDDHTSSDKNYMEKIIQTSLDLCNNTSDYQLADGARKNQADFSPDIFSYSLPSKSGKFLIGQEGAAPYLFPYQPVQIKDSLYPSGLIVGFDIVDDDGTEYTYGINETGSMLTDGIYNQNGQWTSSYHSAWHLNKISSANSDDQIKLSYVSGGSLSQQSYQWSASFLGSASGTSPDHYSNSTFATANATNVSAIFSSLNISKIEYANGVVEFTQSSSRNDLTNAFKLDNIRVYSYIDGIKTLLRTVKFNYSYFLDAASSDGKLKLDGVIIKDAISSDSLYYSFDYFTDTYSWTRNYSDFPKQDYFGYYNGKNNQSLIGPSSYNIGTPSSPNNIPITDGGADRSTVSTFMKQGVLKSITTPTKGRTFFDFENNKYKYNSAEYLAGGLRVKSITNYPDSTSAPLVKRYIYESADGVGIGRLSTNWTPASANVVTQQHLQYSNTTPAGSTGQATQYIISANGQLEIGSFDSAPVYYTKVTEFFENDTSTISNGRNEYTFSFTPDNIVSTPTSYQRSIQFWKRGNLVTKNTYRADNQLVSQTNNTWSNYKEETKTVAGFLNTTFVYEGNIVTSSCSTGLINYSAQPEMSYSSYSYNTGQYKLKSTWTKTDSITTSQSFGYDAYLLPDTTTTTFPYLSKKRESISIYPTHSNYTSSIIADSLISRNMIGIPLETIQRESISGTTSTYYRQKNEYGIFSGNNARGLTSNMLPKATWVDMIGNGLEKRVDYVAYDSDGNLLEYMVDSVSTALVYGYDNELLIAKAERTTRNELDNAFSTLSISENDFETSTLNVAQLSDIADIRDEIGSGRLLTWYAHIPYVGLSQTVSPKGLTESYLYDNYQRLWQTKDHSGNITGVYRYFYADSVASGCAVDPPILVVQSVDTCLVTIQASGCVGTVQWNTGATGSTIQVSTGSVSSYSATCSDGDCISATSNVLSLPELVSGWQLAEIGSPPIDGCVYHNTGTITIKSSGNKGLGSSDQFNFVYKSMSADSVVIIAKLNSISSSPDLGMRSGVMIRSSLAADAPYFEMIFDVAGGAVGKVARTTSATNAQFLQFGTTSHPLWLRIKKRGEEISTWWSTASNPSWNNDANWTETSSGVTTSSAFNAGFLIGIHSFNGSYDTNSLINTSVFSNISIHTF